MTNDIYENLDKFSLKSLVYMHSAFKGIEPTQTLFMDNILYSSCPSISPLTNCVCCVHIVGPCVRLSLRNILFPKHHEESSLEFHQTFQTYLYILDKYF